MQRITRDGSPPVIPILGPRTLAIRRTRSDPTQGKESDSDDDTMWRAHTPNFTFHELNSLKQDFEEKISTPRLASRRGSVSEADHPQFRRIHIEGENQYDAEESISCKLLSEALALRKKYVFTIRPTPAEIAEANKTHTVNPLYSPPDHKVPESSDHKYEMVGGVMRAWRGTKPTEEEWAQVQDDLMVHKPCERDDLFTCITVEDFWTDLALLMDTISSGPCKSFCYNRLKILESRFDLHLLLNSQAETADQKQVPHRDFYNVRKIDNHIHHSACMNQKHLLRFIKHKMKVAGDEIVYQVKETGEKLTLAQIFRKLDMTTYDLSVDSLNMRAHTTFHRFDKFNNKYNPLGQSHLREIFLKYNNYLHGKYLAEVTKEVMDDLEANKYQFCEYRLSIYGRDAAEWSTLASWVCDNDLFHANVRWMIQIPRLYSVYKKNGLLNNFQEMIDNIFIPLFEVTVSPDSDPKLHRFLKQCVGFDSVDDESIREQPWLTCPPPPAEWTSKDNPPYSMWTYYIYANMAVLNRLRESKGFSTFAYRPHSGEAGDVEHLAASFLVANSINHGIVLNESPALQYLYYLAQVGLSMSPLSNNLLWIEYDKNPFFKFFRRGLHVTLSSDDPLMIHVTKEALVEEYSVAAQVWKLNSADVCEIARNSVVQSGFEHKYKAHWIGPRYLEEGLQANNMTMTNVPNIRFAFRQETLQAERRFVANANRAPA